MTWFDYVLLGWWALGTLMAVNSIGKPKKPFTPSAAVILIVIQAALAVGLLASRGVLG